MLDFSDFVAITISTAGARRTALRDVRKQYSPRNSGCSSSAPRPYAVLYGTIAPASTTRGVTRCTSSGARLSQEGLISMRLKLPR